MAQKTYTSLSLRVLGLSLLSSLNLVAGCAEDDGMDDLVIQQPPLGDAGLVADASPVVAGDGGVAALAQDSSVSVLPEAAVPSDGGMVIQPQPDSSTPVPDAGTPDTGVTPDTGAPDAGPARADQGMGDGKDVITIGDSWMNLNNTVGIQQSLEKISKRDYRNFGVPGTKLLDEVIPKQYTMAKGQGPVKTVVMTGGGNDVLQEILLPCVDANFDNDSKCKDQIDRVAARLQKLWAEMAADGVQDVFIIGYSNKTAPLGLGTTAKSIAYSAMKIQPVCDSVPAPLRCTTLDTDKEVPTLKTRGDGIHPDDASYDALGTVVWKVMQEKGMRR